MYVTCKQIYSITLLDYVHTINSYARACIYFSKNDACAGDTPFFVGGIRVAVAMTVRRSHVSTAAVIKPVLSATPFDPLGRFNLRNPRDCYVAVLNCFCAF